MVQKTIYLDRNENNYGPAPACYDVLKRADVSKMSWYTRAHKEGIKSILSARMARDFKLPEDRILLGYGAENILKQAIQCYLGANEKLMVPAYSWWYYKLIASEVNGLSVEYPLVPGPDRFQYDLAGMKEVYRREQPKIVFISSPNNPTGNSLSLEDLQSVLEEFSGTMVVLDEAYAYHGKIDYVTPLVERYPNLLVVRTFSKYYALAGVRIGFGVLGANLAALSKFTNRYLGYHRLSEEIAMAALDSPEYYESIAHKMKADKERYYAELGAIPGFTVYRSDANFILVAIPAEHKEALQKFLTGKGLVVKFMNEELLNSHMRITIGTQEENWMLVAAIKEYFRSLSAT